MNDREIDMIDLLKKLGPTGRITFSIKDDLIYYRIEAKAKDNTPVSLLGSGTIYGRRLECVTLSEGLQEDCSKVAVSLKKYNAERSDE